MGLLYGTGQDGSPPYPLPPQKYVNDESMGKTQLTTTDRLPLYSANPMESVQCLAKLLEPQLPSHEPNGSMEKKNVMRDVY